ncbi:hypothetical protein PISL3812_01836 [Talaromyces islandicus]|uniref:C2H2-type domain-containing protein n=1 Tax=Talaromyces islandicus TaxID=28573 RepID=A0A0U1LN78_TALIS|nr:hypothetical protein PISL3812_01836 [Talaromyces islandicus]
MSSQGSGHSHDYRFQDHNDPSLPSSHEWVLVDPPEEPGINPAQRQQYHLLPSAHQSALSAEIPVNNLPVQDAFQLVPPDPVLLAQEQANVLSLPPQPQPTAYHTSNQTTPIDIPQVNVGQSAFGLLQQLSYSPTKDFDFDSMYASVQSYYHPDITSHPSHLVGAVSSPFSPLDSTMYPQGNRQQAPVHPQQASWPQYQRSLTRTPEDPYQRRPQESLTPPAGFAPLPSQPAVFSNTSFPASMQQPQAQAFYPNSNTFGFNQPNYDFPQTSFVPSNAYPITTGPDPRIPMRTSPYTGSNQSTPTTPEPESQVRVLESRPKPQCWDHGCNGREFSTFSNLLRHQRERSGAAAKSECPHCGAVFTRTTARNTHISQGKCKGIRESTE